MQTREAKAGSTNPSAPTAEDLVAKLREGGFLKEGAEGGATALLRQQLATMRVETHADLSAATHAEGGEKRELSPEQKEALLRTLKGRFLAHPERHAKVQWLDVEKALQAEKPEVLFGLSEMEETGGEPDVFEDAKDAFVFGDCSAESPTGRRNVVFDKVAEEGLRAGTFQGNAVDMAKGYGVNLMDEAQYRALQKLGEFDLNTWSWLKTPADVREAGNALGGDRVDAGVSVFQYYPRAHNVSGGFRAALRVKKH